MSQTNRNDKVEDIHSRLNLSIRKGRLTEDLLSEVKSMFGGNNSVSPTIKRTQNFHNGGLKSPGRVSYASDANKSGKKRTRP